MQISLAVDRLSIVTRPRRPAQFGVPVRQGGNSLRWTASDAGNPARAEPYHPAEPPFLVGSRERKDVARLETRIFSISERKPIAGQRTAEGSAVGISLES
jgi:hypothetical protein